MDMKELITYTLHLADNSLVLGHRNSEWTGHGPVLEQDIAVSNIALDLIGQARNFYQYAAKLINQSAGQNATEDTLVYFRDVHDFKNCLLVEQNNGDWAKTILRQFLFSAYQFFLYRQLQNSSDNALAAIAEKSLKEATYHLRWSSEWVIRLGDGTEESHQRIVKAVDELWMHTDEMFETVSYEMIAAREGYGIDVSLLKNDWQKKVRDIFDEATIPFPPDEKPGVRWLGKEGKHSEYLGYILAELQFLQRAYPNSEW